MVRKVVKATELKTKRKKTKKFKILIQLKEKGLTKKQISKLAENNTTIQLESILKNEEEINDLLDK